MSINRQAIVCENCGSNAMVEQGDYLVCSFCNTPIHRSFFEKQKKLSNFESKFEHAMNRAAAYEQQEKYSDAKCEYRWMIKTFPYRYEGYMKLLTILLSEYRACKEEVSFEEIMTITSDEITFNVNYGYMPGISSYSYEDCRKITQYYDDLDKKLDTLQSVFTQLQGILKEDERQRYSTFLLETQSFINEETDELKTLSSTLKARRECVRLLEKREELTRDFNRYEYMKESYQHSREGKSDYAISHFAIRRYTDKRSFQFNKCAIHVDALKKNVASAKRILYARRVLNLVEGTTATLFAKSLSIKWAEKSFPSLFAKGMSRDGQVAAIFCFFVLMIPVVIIMVKQIKRTAKVKEGLRYFKKNLTEATKDIKRFEKLITDNRNELMHVEEQIRNTEFQTCL